VGHDRGDLPLIELPAREGLVYSTESGVQVPSHSQSGPGRRDPQRQPELRDDGGLDPLRIVENLFDAGVDLVLGEGPELGGDLGVQRIPQPHQFLEVRDPHGTRRCRARGAEARGHAPIVAVQTPNIEHLFDHIPELSATFHRLLRGSRSAVPSICPPGEGYPEASGSFLRSPDTAVGRETHRRADGGGAGSPEESFSTERPLRSTREGNPR